MNIPFPSLLEEIKSYNPNDGFISEKARRVYHLALSRNKNETAKRIARKYKKIKSDLVMSTMLLLQAQRQHK